MVRVKTGGVWAPAVASTKPSISQITPDRRIISGQRTAGFSRIPRPQSIVPAGSDRPRHVGFDRTETGQLAGGITPGPLRAKIQRIPSDTATPIFPRHRRAF